MNPQVYLKAIYGAVLMGLGMLDVAYSSGNNVTWSEGIKIAIGVVGSFGTIWGVPNAVKKVNGNQQ